MARSATFESICEETVVIMLSLLNVEFQPIA
jgi:hypothetical protein